MYYNQEKVREMLRSILPSKARKGARSDKLGAKRGHRSRVRQLLNEYRYEADDDDAHLTMRIHKADRIRDIAIGNAVVERRGADKISHFVRWAESLTSDTNDVREKYFRFVGYIGGSTDMIREHAIGHFISPRYDFRDKEYFRWRNRPIAWMIHRDQMQALLEGALHRRDDRDTANHALRHRCRFRYRTCKEGDACITREYVENRRANYYLLDDGTRVKSWRIKPDQRSHIIKTVYHDYSYWINRHDWDTCDNIVLLNTARDVENILKRLFPGKKKAWGFHDGYMKYRAGRTAARALWDALEGEDG